MKKILFLITIFLLIFNCNATTIKNNKVYFDNTVVSNVNDGKSWGTAFNTLEYLTIRKFNNQDLDYKEWYPLKNNDTQFFIKATNKPYRSSYIFGAGYFYFDAVGYADEASAEVRGTKKAIIYGSKKAIPDGKWPSWYIVKNGWTLTSSPDSKIKIYTSKSPFDNGEITRAYIDGETPQKLIRSTDLPSIKNNEFIEAESGYLFYRNDFEHPGDLNIEFIADNYDLIGIEGSYYMWLNSVSLRYFSKGFIHGSCIVEEVKNLDVSYSAGIGVILNSFTNVNGKGAPFQNIISHHNEGDGIHVFGYDNTKLFNSISHNNQGDGIVLIPSGPDSSDIPRAIISNNTSVNNLGYGYRIYTQAIWSELYPKKRPEVNGYRFNIDQNIKNNTWSIYNNISSHNVAGEFFLEDTLNPLTIWFNGWFGKNNNLFNQNTWVANIVNIAPEFVDEINENFHLKFTSPYIARGITSTVRGRVDINTDEIDGYDIDGDIRDLSTPDIGADEFK